MVDTSTRAPAPVAVRRGTWVVACATAEAVGMTAAAAAATLGDRLAPVAALLVVVAGGLVEGVALGVLQAVALRRWLPGLVRRRYVAATVLVAGLGWAAASAPGVLGDSGGSTPPVALVLLGALALGVVLGAVLGAAQAVALRGAVTHPWRWVGASATAWAPTMVLVFAGATTPDAGWPAGAVVPLGTLTGVVAGTVLGTVSGWYLPSLSGPPPSARIVLALLRTHRVAGLRGALLGLEVRGRRTGRPYRLPVQYAVAPGGLAVVPGDPDHKTWWRNVGRRETPVRILREGVWAPAAARLLTADDPEHDAVAAAYRTRFPRTPVAADQPVLLVRIGADR